MTPDDTKQIIEQVNKHSDAAIDARMNDKLALVFEEQKKSNAEQKKSNAAIYVQLTSLNDDAKSRDKKLDKILFALNDTDMNPGIKTEVKKFRKTHDFVEENKSSLRMAIAQCQSYRDNQETLDNMIDDYELKKGVFKKVGISTVVGLLGFVGGLVTLVVTILGLFNVI